MRLDRLLCVVVSVSVLVFACGREHGHHQQDQGSAHSISGTVHDSSGVAGLESVTVTLSGDSFDTVTTGPDGTFSFTDLADGSYTITPSREGFTFSPESVPVTLSGADQPGVDFAASPVIPPRHAISGTVFGATTVTVTLSGGASGTTTTDAEGRYSFTDLADGDYTVAPSKEGFTFSPESAPVTLSGTDQAGIDFTASPVIPAKHSISGTVRGSSTATLTLSGAASAATTIDADGRYSFTDLDDGEYTVTPSGGSGIAIFAPGDRTVILLGTDVSGVDFAELHNISGSILVQGMVHVAGALVTATDASGQSVGSGGVVQPDYTFRIELVPPGTYTVTPSGEGFSFEPTSATITVDESDRTVSFIASYAPRSISGTVYGGPYVTVQADDRHWGFADGDGRYTISDLTRYTVYTVVAQGFGYTVSPGSRYVFLDMANVVGVDFTASPVPSHDISGTISGLASFDQFLLLAQADMPFPTYLPFYSYFPSVYPNDLDGTYAFDDLPDWSYTVIPSFPGYSFSPEARSVNLAGADATGIDFTAIP